MATGFRIIEISNNGNYLSSERGFLCIKSKESPEQPNKIPLDDILAIIASAHAITYSNSLLIKLADRNIPLIICGSNFHPKAMMVAIDSYYRHLERLNQQINISQPFKKRLWQLVIKEKISNQAEILAKYGYDNYELQQMAKKLRSADPDNYEAQAARIYWNRLFGSNFLRDPDIAGINTMLNYGYAIIRAAIARFLVASGFNTALGIFHHNKLNNFCLVDDFIEPFRPIIDDTVKSISLKIDIDDNFELSPPIKAQLIAILQKEVEFEEFTTTLQSALQKYIFKIGNCYENQNPDCIIFPRLKVK